MFTARVQQLEAQQQECDYEDWVPPERLYAIDILFIYTYIHTNQSLYIHIHIIYYP